MIDGITVIRERRLDLLTGDRPVCETGSASFGFRPNLAATFTSVH
jgi:hypothetical protein